ncbi:hypothetical protein D3C86_2166880 [compost metagenome]
MIDHFRFGNPFQVFEVVVLLIKIQVDHEVMLGIRLFCKMLGHQLVHVAIDGFATCYADI